MNVHWAQICQIIIDRGVREHLSRLKDTLLNISDVNGIEDVSTRTQCCLAFRSDVQRRPGRLPRRSEGRRQGMFASVRLIRSLARQRKK